MSKEFGMLSQWWDGDPEKLMGRLCSRKFNGWSALWDGGVTRGMLATDVPWYYKGKDQPMLSTGLWTLGRHNRPKVVCAPDFWLNQLPVLVPLHGELWYKDRLDIIKRVCGTKSGYSPMWGNIKYIMFNSKPYSMWEGIEKIPKYIKNKHNVADIFALGSNDLEQLLFALREIEKTNKLMYPEDFILETISTRKIEDTATLEHMLNKATSCEWEGLMFANPTSGYECKRTRNSFKQKSSYDYEGTIEGYVKGKTGKNVGKVGALFVKLKWDRQIVSIFGGKPHMVGKEIEVPVCGLSDTEREWHNCKSLYPVGSKIKFTFYGVSVHAIPASANITRE